MEFIGAIIGSLIAGILGVWGGIRVAKIELEKTRPELIPHGCRLINQQVYTYFTGRKEHIGPICVYLDKTNFLDCTLSDSSPNYTEGAMQLKKHNNGHCYIASFADNEQFLKAKKLK
jgi:hypothetical protein